LNFILIPTWLHETPTTHNLYGERDLHLKMYKHKTSLWIAHQIAGCMISGSQSGGYEVASSGIQRHVR
jgi:hypothetical protein